MNQPRDELAARLFTAYEKAQGRSPAFGLFSEQARASWRAVADEALRAPETQVSGGNTAWPNPNPERDLGRYGVAYKYRDASGGEHWLDPQRVKVFRPAEDSSGGRCGCAGCLDPVRHMPSPDPRKDHSALCRSRVTGESEDRCNCAA